MLLMGKMFFPLSKPLQFILFKKRHTSTQDVGPMLHSKKMSWLEDVNFFSIQEGSIQLWKLGGGGEVAIMGAIIIDHQHLE